MDTLLNLHGKFFGTFWACETCAEVGWSPQFKSRNEIEIHMSKVHINTKMNKLNIDNKIENIIATIIEYDKEFKSSIDQDFDEAFQKVKHFIGIEENLKNLDDTNFKFLMKQIKSFYLETDNYESLVNYKYKIDYVTDIITGNETAFIIETEAEKLNFITNCDTNLSNFSKTEDKAFETFENICHGDKIIDSENMSISFQKEDETLSSGNLKDFRDATLSCDDKEIEAPKRIFNNKDDCESDDNIDNDEVVIVNIGNMKNNTVDITEDLIKMENSVDSKENKPDEIFNKYNDFFNSLLNKTTINMSKATVKTSEIEITTFGNDTNKAYIYCDKCSYKTTKNVQMKWHTETYHEVIFFSCEQFESNLSLKSDLIDHIQEEKCEVDEKDNTNVRIKCEEFGDNFVLDKSNADEQEISVSSNETTVSKDNKFESEEKVQIYKDCFDKLKFEWDDPLILLESKSLNRKDKIEYYDKVHLFEKSHSIQEEILMMEEMSQKIKFPCNDCDNFFNSQIMLNIYIKSNPLFYQECTQPMNICDKCDKSFSGTLDLYRHKLNVREQGQYSCDRCEYNPQKKEYLRRHKKIPIQLNKESSCEKYEKRKRNTILKVIKEWKNRRKKKDTEILIRGNMLHMTFLPVHTLYILPCYYTI